MPKKDKPITPKNASAPLEEPATDERITPAPASAVETLPSGGLKGGSAKKPARKTSTGREDKAQAAEPRTSVGEAPNHGDAASQAASIPRHADQESADETDASTRAPAVIEDAAAFSGTGLAAPPIASESREMAATKSASEEAKIAAPPPAAFKQPMPAEDRPAPPPESTPPPIAEAKPLPIPEPPAPPTWEPPIVEAPEPEPAPEPMPEPVSHYHEAHDLPHMPSMFIVHITPELAPVAKVGGLADVVFGLSRELEYRGNHVEVILPKYDCMRYDHIWGLCETFSDLWVPWYGGAVHCSVYFGFVHGRKCFFIEPHSQDNFFNRGYFYGGFKDDVMRFAFFSRAAMEFLLKAGKQPDVIHCHDWQTALVPVFLYEIYKFLGMGHPRVCFTIHNFQHQGITGAQLLQATGLNRPEYYLHYDRLLDNRYPNALNLTKGGVVYSNFITTVSPRHASEAKDQGQGFGLESTLHIHHAKYGGVVNGVDYDVWNPEIDRYIPFHYNADNIDDKYKDKRALRERLWLADNEKPIVAFIGRLDPQKGLELIRHALFYTLQARGQFLLLGSSADNSINGYFWSLKHQLNDNPDCHLEIGFNDELSHLIYAGADMMLVPSRFEPCGLTQLIAMRYGTIPIVREVGGLADTVFDKDYSWKPLNERNGYVFKDYDDKGLESALGRAISCYYQYPDHFRDLIRNAMHYDYSWKYPGQDYLNIYDYIREK